uniref:Apolipoprotein M n=1 Tax=Dicentrarchus labrax TaxID=13489 RepID=E6ZF16_DICLA|nr:Uncharacterized protein [Dicentrarchus labrax]
MKTLCVAVVVLSFSSVCQPASLACERLLKPEARNPDLTGRWRYVALSSDLCPTRTIMESVFRPAMEMNITSEVTPNVYSLGFKFKILGMCIHKSHFSTFVYENNTVSAADSNSRRETVTAAEMKEFETQAKCSGLPEPQLFMSDHVYENCTMLEDFLHTFSSQVDIEKAVSLNEKIMNCRQQR